MFDFIFDGVQAYNAGMLLLIGAVMLAIGALCGGMWLRWRLRGVRVRGRIVAVKSSGVRRSDADWEAEYREKSSAPAAEKSQIPAGVAGYLTAAIVILVPLAFLGFGSFLAYEVFDLRANGAVTVATVVEVEAHYDSENGTTYAPVLSFRDNAGLTYRKADRISSSSQPYSVGERLEIFYDPDEPARFIINDFWRYMVLALVFIVIGGGILVAALWFGFFHRPMPPGAARRRKEIEKLRRAYEASQHYVPVYEFAGPDGEMIRVDGTENASNWLADKLPGQVVTLMVLPRRGGGAPHVKRPGKAMLVFALIFAAGGVFLLYQGVRLIAFTPAALLLAFGVAGLLAYKLRGLAGGLRRSGDLTLSQIKEGFAGVTAETRNIEGYELTAEEIRARLRMIDRNALLGVPVLLLFGAGLLFGSYHVTRQIYHLEGGGMVAQGAVERLESRSGGEGGAVYYPEIFFRTGAGEEIRFVGKVGSNPPAFRVGDKVLVLYDPQNPHDAIVDYGAGNWLAPLAMLLVGALMVFYALALLNGIKARAGRR